MDIKDLLAVPQLFCIKKNGVLQPSLGMADDEWLAKALFISVHHGVTGCDDRLCGCTDLAFAELAKGCSVVPVALVEVIE